MSGLRQFSLEARRFVKWTIGTCSSMPACNLARASSGSLSLPNGAQGTSAIGYSVDCWLSHFVAHSVWGTHFLPPRQTLPSYVPATASYLFTSYDCDWKEIKKCTEIQNIIIIIYHIDKSVKLFEYFLLRIILNPRLPRDDVDLLYFYMNT